MIDICFNCPVSKVIGTDDSCPLPFCLIEKCEKLPFGAEVMTAVLWERGKTVESIQEIKKVKKRQQVMNEIGRWRDRKRALGLLV